MKEAFIKMKKIQTKGSFEMMKKKKVSFYHILHKLLLEILFSLF